ncbi:MAG: cytidylate kinase-like family protein [Tannerella sp.]|jgi:cytidylate kinase|nr:cytidylate kinase-like family protein [Tannerella sp.]
MIITIGRQLCSGGSEIGKKLSESLGIAYYDKELIVIASKESGLSAKLFEKADERTQKGISAGLFDSRFQFMGNTAIAYGWLSNDTFFKIQSDVIRNLAEKQSCVFIGRCADYILRNRKDCFKIFLSASDEDRIRKIMESENISVEKARDIMKDADKKRAAYYNYYTNKTWGAGASYDICINTSLFGIDGTVSVIEEMIKKLPF